MATNRGETELESKPSSSSTGQNQPSSLDRRLEPLEEFRSRAEGWMKEVTAQVARLASSFEQEENKRSKLEDRLADIEERIRSLLTLTEMVSQDKNPFVPQPSTPPGPQAPEATPEPDHEVVDPFASAGDHHASIQPEAQPEDPDGVQEDKGPEPTSSTGQQVAEPDPHTQETPLRASERPGVEVIPVGPQPRNQALQSEEPEPGEETVPARTDHDDLDEEPREEPAQEPAQEIIPWSVPAPETMPPPEDENRGTGYHPNDAEAEPEASENLEEAAPREREPVPSADDSTTARRLLVVAWADLLAPACKTVDVEAFTRFYVDAKWIDAETARLVERLVETMAEHEAHRTPGDVRTLHEETVRLLAQHDPSLSTFTRVDSTHESETEAETEADAPANAT